MTKSERLDSNNDLVHDDLTYLTPSSAGLSISQQQAALSVFVLEVTKMAALAPTFTFTIPVRRGHVVQADENMARGHDNSVLDSPTCG